MVRAASLWQGTWADDLRAAFVAQVQPQGGQRLKRWSTAFPAKTDEVHGEVHHGKNCEPEVVRPRLVLTPPPSVPDELRMSDEHVQMEREAEQIGDAVGKLEKAYIDAFRKVVMPPAEPIHVLAAPPLGQLKPSAANPDASVAGPEGLGPGYPERQSVTAALGGQQITGGSGYPETPVPTFEQPPFPGYTAATRTSSTSSFLAVMMRGPTTTADFL
mmetsp:Transcript_68126/g.127215  ORF Transcript_68126/g.127215 Transcript_68126/m.127215 type:complete len:216 (-) Transcript_68126:6-653(-)